MKKILLLFVALLTSTTIFADDFDKYFTEKSLRVDFALAGDSESQSAYIQQLRCEPVWGGPRKNLIDKFNYGGYYINVYDKADNKLIYSRSFNTLFEEWRTTDLAKGNFESWTNSMSVPFPKVPIRVEITARNKANMEFEPLLEKEIDPSSIFIDHSELSKSDIVKIINNGDSKDKVDLVFIAEGYKACERDKFIADAKRFAEELFKVKPYDSRKADFNIWAVMLESQDSGTDASGKGVWKNTALNSGYYTFGLDRYLTTPDYKSIKDAVWDVPCDAIFLLVNATTYGGGGMYNFYGMSTVDNDRTNGVFIHEFGHSFAGLADEYFESTVAYNDFYNLKYEPWEPNITTLVDFKNQKWADMIEIGTPIPTQPDEKNPGKVGVFEGGGYLAKGIYRPMNHCFMRSYGEFCPVCQRAISDMIDFLSDKKMRK